MMRKTGSLLMKQNIGKLNELADVAAGMYDCPVVCHSPNLKFLI